MYLMTVKLPAGVKREELWEKFMKNEKRFMGKGAAGSSCLEIHSQYKTVGNEEYHILFSADNHVFLDEMIGKAGSRADIRITPIFELT